MWLVFLRKIREFYIKLNSIIKIWGVSPVKIIFSQIYSDEWTKSGVDIGICLGTNQGNFQLHRFIRRENTAKISYLQKFIYCETFQTRQHPLVISTKADGNTSELRE